MIKYFFKSLFKIIGVLATSFLIFLCLLGIFILFFSFPIPALVIVFVAISCIVAYIEAKHDYEKDKELSYHVGWSLISDEYDKLLDACRASDISGNWQSAQTHLLQFQNLLAIYKQEHGSDSTYTSFIARLETLLRHYPIPA